MKQVGEPRRHNAIKQAGRWFFWPSYLNSLLLLIPPHTSHLPRLTKKRARNLSTAHPFLRQTLQFSFRYSPDLSQHPCMFWWAKKHCIVCVQCLQDPWGSHSSGKTFVSSISKIISHIIIALHCLFNCCYLQKSSGVAPPLKRSTSPFWLLWTFSNVSLEKSSKDLNL